ncbi:hypothetical protein [Chitinophaga defluvii]|uniref:Uncharacterized protein n=1 Tax=Chitinophaga defluvii TaxID=3163343 RepID=A0ABV2T482_9BACT
MEAGRDPVVQQRYISPGAGTGILICLPEVLEVLRGGYRLSGEILQQHVWRMVSNSFATIGKKTLDGA